jgi:hypothetical protein
MFESYLDFTLKHPSALGEVLRLGYNNGSVASIHKGYLCSYYGWSKVTETNIPLKYDIKKNNKHVTNKHKLWNMVEIWSKHVFWNYMNKQKLRTYETWQKHVFRNYKNNKS